MHVKYSVGRLEDISTRPASPGAKNRAKGHDFERKVVNAFRNAGWLTAKRHLEFQAAECKGYDLDNTTPFYVQCKHLRDYASISVLNTVDAPRSGVPVLVTKPADGPTVVCLHFKDFIRMARALKRAGIDLSSPTAEDF